MGQVGRSGGSGWVSGLGRVGCVGRSPRVRWVGGLPAWVSRPERPKGAKDEVKARRAPNKKSGPRGPLDFYNT